MTEIPSLLSPEIVDDPYPYYRRLREEAPVHWDDGMKSWVVSRHEDVQSVLRSADVFASKRFGGRSALSEALAAQMRPLAARFLLFQDPPDHTRVRGLVSKAFTPRAVQAMRGDIERITNRLLDEAAAKNKIDVVTDLAFPLPAEVICQMLGTPLSDREAVKGWSNDLEEFFGAARTDEKLGERALASFLAMRDYFRPLFAARRVEPRDDLLTALVQAEENGNVLGEDELFATCALLFFAGHHTTANTVGNSLLALFNDPAALARIRENPSLTATAIDEFIRFDSSTQLLVRTAQKDVVIRDQKILARQRVIPVLGSANRDPAVFTDPDRLDLSRPDVQKLMSFGHGIHFCIGAALARLEGGIALRLLFERFPDMALSKEERCERLPAVVFRGLTKLPVVLKP